MLRIGYAARRSAAHHTHTVPLAIPLILTLATLLVCLVFVGSAAASSAWWRVDSLSMPATLARGSTGSLFVSAVNLGDAEVNGSSPATVRLRDVVPAGLVA